MHVARLNIGMAEYNTNGKTKGMALEMAHSGGKLIPTWSFLCHGFLMIVTQMDHSHRTEGVHQPFSVFLAESGTEFQTLKKELYSNHMTFSIAVHLLECRFDT